MQFQNMMGGGGTPPAQMQASQQQILAHLRQQPVPMGWQGTVRPEERANKVVQL